MSEVFMNHTEYMNFKGICNAWKKLFSYENTPTGVKVVAETTLLEKLGYV